MKAAGGGLIALAVLIALSGGAQAADLTENDFSSGIHIQTMAVGGALTLNITNQTTGAYAFKGNFTSQVLDAGTVVEWGNVTWVEIPGAGHAIAIRTRAGNTSSPDSSWEAFSQNLSSGDVIASGASRYIQFAAMLETADNTSSPVLQEVTLSYQTPPQVSLDSPADNAIVPELNVSFACSASGSGLTSLTLYTDSGGIWQANASATITGGNGSAEFNFTDIAPGTYQWNCKASGNNQEVFSSTNRTVTVVTANQPPVISSSNVTPATVANGTDVKLSISATDDGLIVTVWAELTLPNSSRVNVSLVNGGTVNYTPQAPGNYGVLFMVADTGGLTASAQSSFQVSQPIALHINVQDYNKTGVTSTISLLKGGSVVATFSDASGVFDTSVVGDTYDVQVSAFAGSLVAVLKGVDIGQEPAKTVGLGTPAVAGYKEVFAVDNTYTITGGSVTLRYQESLFINESAIGLYVCHSWDFSAQTCTTVFSRITAYEQDETANTFSFNVTAFSAFGLKQEGSCGDAVCSTEESAAACPQDCECDASQTRSCGSDQGECSFGTETCSNGKWGFCVGGTAPATELCNQKDDDCDGVVDNIGNGSSVTMTQCQCYGGGSPQTEVCNNIDDNCDGTVDGMTKACGSNIGACSEGTQTCSDGVFQDCAGDAKPQEEVCGDGVDNNCDSMIDEGCPSCTNNVRDGDEEGVDCGGSCTDTCSQFPVWILAVVVIIALAAVFVFLKLRGKGGWKKLEKEYTYKPAGPAAQVFCALFWQSR